MTPFDLTILSPGDVCLYRPTGLFGRIIAIKTWFPIGHAEVYVGNGQSIASRDGLGAEIYPLRTTDLAYVLRPRVAWDRDLALDWFDANLRGQPYGWYDLFQFVGLNIDRGGIVCSPCATLVLRAGGVPIFGNQPALKIAPCSFLLSEMLEPVWSDARDGQ